MSNPFLKIKDPAYDHDHLCQYHPSNVALFKQTGSVDDWAKLPHRDGTIWSYLKWLFDAPRCDVKINKLQEALDRL